MDSSSSSQSNNPTSDSPTSYQTVPPERNTIDHQKKNINGGKKSAKLSTDAQSIAARERRHRISERFKILQSLIPGGTKMDTVSMLEEAINYVKFLETQIWLHQTLINSVDVHAGVNPNLYAPGPASPYNMVAGQLPNALPQMGLPHSATSIYDNQERMDMPNFDATFY